MEYLKEYKTIRFRSVFPGNIWRCCWLSTMENKIAAFTLNVFFHVQVIDRTLKIRETNQSSFKWKKQDKKYGQGLFSQATAGPAPGWRDGGGCLKIPKIKDFVTENSAWRISSVSDCTHANQIFPACVLIQPEVFDQTGKHFFIFVKNILFFCCTFKSLCIEQHKRLTSILVGVSMYVLPLGAQTSTQGGNRHHLTQVTIAPTRIYWLPIDKYIPHLFKDLHIYKYE